MERLEGQPPLWMTGELVAANGNRRLLSSEDGKTEAWCDDKDMKFIRVFYNRMEVMRYDRPTGIVGFRPSRRADISWKGLAMLANYMLGLKLVAYDNGKVAYNGYPLGVPYEKWTYAQVGKDDMLINVDGMVKVVEL